MTPNGSAAPDMSILAEQTWYGPTNGRVPSLDLVSLQVAAASFARLPGRPGRVNHAAPNPGASDRPDSGGDVDGEDLYARGADALPVRAARHQLVFQATTCADI